MIDSAGLITLELGMSDILNRVGCVLLSECFPEGINFSSAGDIAKAVKVLVSELYDGYRYWVTGYRMILDYIKDHNPDAAVVIIGAVNPLFNLTISDTSVLPVGTALSVITTWMNQYYRQWAKEYGYVYVDISNVELEGMEDEVSFNDLIFDSPNTHPTPNGYRQMARMIIKALKESEKAEKTNVNNIVVDLGRFNRADYVLVDGVPVTDYTVEDSVLVIPSRLHNKKNLTVGVKQNGKLSVTTYELVYHNGYTAYRIYTTNSVSGTLTKLGSSAKSAATRVLSLFKK